MTLVSAIKLASRYLSASKSEVQSLLDSKGVSYKIAPEYRNSQDVFFLVDFGDVIFREPGTDRWIYEFSGVHAYMNTQYTFERDKVREGVGGILDTRLKAVE